MVICRDILASITVMFVAFSFVFTVTETTGEYWIVYTFYGSWHVYGLWKYCIGIYRKKDCIQNPLTKGNNHLRLTVTATFWGIGKDAKGRRVSDLCRKINHSEGCDNHTYSINLFYIYFFTSGNYLMADVGMVAACVLSFLGLIISLVMKFSKLSQKGYTNLGGILTFTLFLGGKKLLYFRYKFT